MQAYTVSFTDPEFSTKLTSTFKQYGVTIVTNVFSKDYCDSKMSEMVGCFERLGTGVDRRNLQRTWTRENLPPQTRPGLFQTLMGHTAPVWDIRTHQNVKRIFQTLYSDLRGRPINDYIVSFDGVNVVPNTVGPYDNGKDWAHLDQTTKEGPGGGNIFKCIQGQAVLTNTTAAFRCTPGSCHSFPIILNIGNVPDRATSNWHMFDKFECQQLQTLCQQKGLPWQIPIHSPAGSFIVWSSSTVHSAKMPDRQEPRDPRDAWKGWRGVVYVCYRPREEIRGHVIGKRQHHLHHNRQTNHWGELVVSAKPGGRYLYMNPRHPAIEGYLNNPVKVYDVLGAPNMSPELLELI